jgi:hypothetical protein
MPKEAKRVQLTPSTDLILLVETLKVDKLPRVLERDGEDVAAIVSIEDLRKIALPSPSGEGIARALAAAGTWKEIDAEELVEKFYKWRHESPPSDPVRLDDNEPHR